MVDYSFGDRAFTILQESDDLEGTYSFSIVVDVIDFPELHKSYYSFELEIMNPC